MTDNSILKYKPDFSRAQQYWRAFWQKELIDRPCTCVWVHTAPTPLRSSATQPVDITDFQAVFKVEEKYLQSCLHLGEAMPIFRPGFGPDQFAGFLGAPIKMTEDNSTSWSEKIVDDWESFLPLRIRKDSACWRNMKRFHAAAEAHCKGKCLLCDIDLHSNIDALEGLRGAQKLLFDLIDTPELIREAMQQARRIYREVSDEFNDYGEKDRWGTASSLFLYSQERCGSIQADFICLLSPDMFREFVMPAIEEEAEYFDHSCFHLDGPDSLKHLDDILAIESIDAIQWVPGVSNKPQLQWSEVLHRIQAARKNIIIYGTPEEIKEIHGQYKLELLVYEVAASSLDAANDFLEWLKGNT